jgi:hypothetical protein
MRPNTNAGNVGVEAVSGAFWADAAMGAAPVKNSKMSKIRHFLAFSMV